MNFGTGSILNIFKSIRLTHRSGEILEQIDGLNVLANASRFWKYSQEDRKKLDGLLNNSVAQGSGEISYANLQPDGTHVAVIPLSLLCGVFGNENQYCPATLVAGMKIELELAPISEISTDPVGSVTMTISAMKPTLVLDTAQLYDVVNKQLLEEQTQVDRSGLQFSYMTYFGTSQDMVAGATSINYDIQQSASLVHKIVTIVRDNQKLKGSGANSKPADKYDCIAPFDTWQYRLGSLYWPQQAIRAPGANWDTVQKNSKEAYALSLNGWMAGVDEFHKSAGGEASVTFSDKIEAVIQGGQWVSGKAMYAFTGEKSACGLELTGEPTNNSRILNFNASLTSLLSSANGGLGIAYPANGTVTPSVYYDLAGGLKVNIYLQYLRVANLMGDNCVVDR
jgi:hypothetical protein